MIKNNLKTAWRSFRKNKVFSFINIIGLAIGISASLVIFLIVSYDYSFNTSIPDKDRIYRVVSDFKFSGEDYHNAGVPLPLANTVGKELTGIDKAVPFNTNYDEAKISLAAPGKEDAVVFRKQKNIIFADPDYFDLIKYDWIAGSPAASLTAPSKVVLTSSAAATYFPQLSADQVIGKQLYFNDTVITTVSGVVKDLSYNTDFNFKVFISRATLAQTTLKPFDWEEWGNTSGSSQLLVRLSPGSKKTQVEQALKTLFNKNYKPKVQDHSITNHSLQPLSDLHYNATYGGYDLPLSHKPTLYGLLAVAAFLLLLACINFINLTTAQASQRAKEIGVKKTMGSSRKQLIQQFLSETFLLTLIATVLSLLIAPLLLKVFADFIPPGLHFDLTKEPAVIIFLLLLIPLVSLFSGFYPALILSSYQPVKVLKNQAYVSSGKSRSAWLRKSLTVSQFVIAQVFIIATILVGKQISFSLSKDMGFKKDAIVTLQTNFYDTARLKRLVLVDAFKAIPAVANISLSTSPPSSNSTWSGTMKYNDGKKEIETDVEQKYADTNYLNLFKIKLLAGTNYPASDSVNAFVINETYLHALGFTNPQDVVGKFVEWSNKKIQITGVVADFNQRSLREKVRPIAMGTWPGSQRTFNIALHPEKQPGDWKKALAKMEVEWKKLYPEDDFEYSFFDESIAQYYTAEQHIASLLMWATGLAIFISCLGLLGLVIYITNQRTKEIGVRKTVGATVTQIVTLLSKDFLRLVIIAFVIAVPITWWGSVQWLNNFAYKTDISVWIFLAGGMIMFSMALLILCIRSFQAATVNPVKSLRSE
ncbi:ABC transporter permease [Ferruginibacter paludis]|uniref:ABC transporter permease n=1 Tax=Ferruginibacter paludis TaxID=1310417 RepID=UPI0025B2AB7A|nr:ABC transporter permease [Ferruginibacter paludis]MDN3655924.1 ABC transporter permease [Ferruginibacter paludis]